MSFNDPAQQSILRLRPFLLYWNARTFAGIAAQMVGVAVGWQIYSLTGNPFDLGLVGLFQFLPATVLILVAGQVADRYDRRRIVQICQIVECLAATTLAYATFTGSISKGLILTAVFFLGASRSFEAPTMQTLLPMIVPEHLFTRAVAASSSAQQAATIGGPALGGALYLVSPTLVYVLCATLFLCAAVQLMFLRVQHVKVASRPPISPEVFFAGVSFIRHNPILLGVIMLDLFAVLLGGAMALLPIFAKDIFAIGPSGLGLLRAAPAVGAITMMIALTRWPLTHRVGRIEFLTVGVFGVATIVFGLSRSLSLTILALLVMGAADAISVVVRVTLVQLATPDEKRGRVSAVSSLFITMSNQLGDFRAGTMASLIGAIPAVLVGGIGTVLVVIFGSRIFTKLYRLDTFQDARPKEEDQLAVALTPAETTKRSGGAAT
jgi:MFS family permease